MAKLTLNDVTSGYSAATVINANNDRTETALENTLSRDGSAPNGMNASLDMNSNRVVNLGSPQSGTDAARWADVTDGVDLTGVAVPSQTGNADRALFTDGSNLAFRKTPYISRTAAEIAASVTPTDYSYSPGDVRRYGAVGDGSTDCSAAILAACNQNISGGAQVVIPGATSFYRCNSAIALTAGCKIRGDGTQPTLRFYGCNGFELPDEQAGLYISGVELFSLNSGGTVDPKTHSAIAVSGSNGGACNYIFLKDLYLRGWNRGIDLSYTWNSTIDNCTTINCNIGVRMFGQCVNNVISNSRLGANTGTHSISLVKDGATTGEGLLVSNTLMASGAYGIQSDGFLSLHVAACTTDLITDTAYDFTNVKSFSLSGGWHYATNYGVRWNDLSVAVNQEGSIQGARIETTASGSRPILIGAGNSGISITGGALTCASAGASRCAYVEIDAENVSMIGTHLVNPSSNTSIFAANQSFSAGNLTGNATIQYNAFPVIASAAALVVPKVGDVFKVSGTTNVTSIAAASSNLAGKRITLIFADVLTFTDGNNLKLAGNLVTSADDTITLVSDGTDWFECARSVN